MCTYSTNPEDSTEFRPTVRNILYTQVFSNYIYYKYIYVGSIIFKMYYLGDNI